MKNGERQFEQAALGPRGVLFSPPSSPPPVTRTVLPPLDVITRLIDAAERLDAAAVEGVKKNWSAAGCRALHTEAGACTQAALWLISIVRERDTLGDRFTVGIRHVPSSGDMTASVQG